MKRFRFHHDKSLVPPVHEPRADIGRDEGCRGEWLAPSFDAGIVSVLNALAGSFAYVMSLMIMLIAARAMGQEVVLPATESANNEQFVPVDQMEAVFDRDHRGVLMKRIEFNDLLKRARANAEKSDVPVPIITEQASVAVTPGDQQALVTMELKVRQYAEGWQIMTIRAGNLLIEKIEIDQKPAMIIRNPANSNEILLAHETVGEFTVVATMSTQLGLLGSDRTAAFELPGVPATQLSVTCPPEKHLLVNDLKLAAANADGNYVIPVGNAPDVRLRWVVQRQETEAQTLVFSRTDAQLQVQKETLRWESDSRISVFGGSINRIIARVPQRLEVTSVESAGLEGWTLEDDPDHAGQTRVTLTYRQPFTNDRVVRFKAVAANTVAADADPAKSAMQAIPTLTFNEVTAHTGRLVVAHEDGLRLVCETGSGVRRVSALDLGLSTESSVFDFWQQQFDLKVAARPRDQELFADSSGRLNINDTDLTYNASLQIETLNAPLFEIVATLPADWQLKSVFLEKSTNDPAQPTWTTGSNPGQILIKPPRPVAPGEILPLGIQMHRTIADPDVEQKIALPVVAVENITTVGGTYLISFADDLIVSPLSLTGLTPVAGAGTEQVFQNLGTEIHGELSIARKPSRLAARSVLKTWADSRQLSFDGEIITDVLNGTIRTLTIRLSESLGPDVRFTVRDVGHVPGMQQTCEIRPVSIIEQTPGPPVDGLRPFTLKLDHRFAGSLSLHTHVQQPRDATAPIAAPIVQVSDAVRQHGVLVFEASPEQQLSVGPEVRSIPGLFLADAGLVDAPDPSTARRVALTFRYVQPGYSFNVTETRFATNAVPSAVCEQMANICTLSDSGSIQRWCEAIVQTSGVQTLRFTLPGGEEKSFLWSTMLNGEPVEVRRDGADYLVSVPTHSESQQHRLTVLFETAASKTSAFGQTRQEPVPLSMDAGDQKGLPIDVLLQSWRVHYPQSSMLVDADGQFRPTQGVDQPGWLVTLGQFSLPDVSDLPKKLIPLSLFLCVLFVLTVMISRRRWKTLAAVIGLAMLVLFFSFVRFASQERSATRYFGAPKGSLPSPDYLTDDIAYLPPGAETDRRTPPPMTAAPAAGPGGMGVGGFGGGGMAIPGMGGMGVPGDASPNAASDFVEILPPGSKELSDNSPFGSGQSASPPRMQEGRAEVLSSPRSENDALAMDEPTSPAPAESRFGEDFDDVRSRGSVRARKGVARLSVNVNLDVPEDYRTREFVSVADAVHAPAVLTVIVQRRSQIAAVRFLAALLVTIVAWRLRKTRIMTRLTFAVILLLISFALLPLISNTWQSVLDGLAIGSVLSVLMAFICGCVSLCSCPLTWIRRKSVSAG
ncbi:MAG: hypothetical protein ACK58L_03100 [Planctomycetota bacterium]